MNIRRRKASGSLFHPLSLVNRNCGFQIATYSSGSHSLTIGTLAPGTQNTFSMPCLRNISANISTPCSPSHDVQMQISTSLVLVPRSLTVELDTVKKQWGTNR